MNNWGRKTPATLAVDVGTSLNIKQGWHTVAFMHVQDQYPSVNELPSTHITGPPRTCASPSALGCPESACSGRFSPPLTLHHHRVQSETCKPLATAHCSFWNTKSAETIWLSWLFTHDFFLFSWLLRGSFVSPELILMHQTVQIFGLRQKTLKANISLRTKVN